MTDQTRRTLLKFSLATTTTTGLVACGGGSAADGTQGPSGLPKPPPEPPVNPPLTPPVNPPTPLPPADPSNPPPKPPPLPNSDFLAGWTVQKRTLTTVARHNDTGLPNTTKHTTLARHPNGRAYLFGGDFPSTTGYADSGSQIQYSLKPSLWVEPNPASGWRLEQEYWPADGNQYPVHHDKSAVAWDSRRRVFWMVGGFNFGNGSDAQANKIPFVAKVAKFDPAKAKGTQWSATSAAYIGGGSEKFGNAVYDPVLDVVISFNPSLSGLQIFDCSAAAWLGHARFPGVAGLDIPRDGYVLNVLAIDPTQRLIWVMRSDSYSTTKNIYKVRLPTARSGLAAAGSANNWASVAVELWANPNQHDTVGGCTIEDGRVRKWYGWRKGPVGNDSQMPGKDIGNAIYGITGRPLTGNGNFGSAHTAVLVDLDSGAESYGQLPLPTFEDGVGWVIPNITYYDSASATLVYGTCAFEANEVEGKKIEARMSLAKRKPVPAWIANLPINSWYAIPGSTCESSLPTDVRNLWSAAEGNGYRGCELNQYQNPWNFSGMALRQRDSVCLFHGGGGGDGRANGVLGFVLNRETPSWIMAMPPTARSQTLPAGGGSFEFNRIDNATESTPRTPVAVHAYTSCFYLDAEDMWLRFGSQMVHPTDQGYFNGVHGFWWSEVDQAYNRRSWSINARAAMPQAGIYPNRSFVKHPWTEDVIGGSGGTFHWWKRASNTWQTRIDGGVVNDERYAPSAIDPVNNVLLFAGNPSLSLWPRLIELDTGTARSGSAASWVGPAVDSGEWKGSDAAFTWDNDNQCLWALKAVNGSDASFDLYKVRLANKSACQWRVEKITTAVAPGSVRPDFTSINQGIYNRFQWVAELGGLVLSTSYQRPIWFIKTSTRT
ncbi:MAG: hypothetical protein RR412_08185 [Burkholderiaceae bacterium]